jgi:hypothetical protein
MTMADRGHSGASPDDVDRAKGPSKGDKDYGGHDAEAEGDAESGVRQPIKSGPPKSSQAPADRPELGEEPVTPGTERLVL